MNIENKLKVTFLEEEDQRYLDANSGKAVELGMDCNKILVLDGVSSKRRSRTLPSVGFL